MVLYVTREIRKLKLNLLPNRSTDTVPCLYSFIKNLRLLP